jgi:hypothetical protein
MRNFKLNNLIKWSLISFSFSLIACSVNRDLRHKTKTNTVKLNPLNLAFNYHFKNGNYIISINDSIGSSLTDRFINLQDSSAFKNDTIDLELTDAYWTKTQIIRVLRSCIEMNEINIYSISESEYLNKIKRIVSKSKFKDIHSRYLYTNVTNGDTILYSFSFDTGTPPF